MNDNNNRGAVWKNSKREKDTHPHWTGTAMVDGVEYWVSAWKKRDDAGEKAPSISFTFKLKEETKKAAKASREFDDDFDSSIPF